MPFDQPNTPENGQVPLLQNDGTYVTKDGREWVQSETGHFYPYDSSKNPLGGGSDWGMRGALSDENSKESRAFLYGGDPGAANADTAQARSWGQMAQSRAPVAVDLGNANASRALLLGQQGRLVDASHGGGPTLADMQQQGALNAIGQQSSMAHAAPRLSLAVAQRAAINGSADAAGAASNAAASARAQEIAGARGEAMGLTNNLRSQDQAQAMQTAKLAQQQRAMNDAATMAAERRGLDVAQLGMNGQQAQGAARRTWEGMAQAQGQRDQDQQDAARNAKSNAILGGFSALYHSMGSAGTGG